MSEDFSSTRRFLAAALPWLASERLIRNGQAPPDTAFALTERNGNALRLAAVSRAGHALGLQPGLPLADVRARFPDLIAFEHDPVSDAAMLDAIAAWCDRYSPLVAVDAPDAVVIDITGCVHLYGDEAALGRDLSGRLGRAGLSACVGTGDTPEAAAARARFGNCATGDLPLAALRADPRVLAALRRAGLRTIGDIARRPRVPFAARFGKDLLDRLDRLTGAADSRLTPRRVPPEVTAEARFAEPVARVDDVLDTIALLTGEAAAQLLTRGQGGRRFEVALFRSDNQVRYLAVETGSPTRDVALVARLMRERIEALVDPLDPGFGYDLIRLDVPRTDPLAPSQAGLLERETAQTALATLHDRLMTRLGPRALSRLAIADSHIPECAAHYAPTSCPAGGALPADQPPRPIRLLDPPQRIEVMAMVPDGPPRWFRWRGKRHDVVLREGPERIAAEWWRRPQGHLPGEGGTTRDYYRVEDSAGQRFWLFRHGLYDERAQPDWYIHGLFA